MALSDMDIVMPTGSGGTNGVGMDISHSTLTTLHTVADGHYQEVDMYVTNNTAGDLNLTLSITDGTTTKTEVIKITAYTKQKVIDGQRFLGVATGATVIKAQSNGAAATDLRASFRINRVK
jgi:hypothetical protein